MKLRVVKTIPLVTAKCKRCELTFRYFRRSRFRYYCEPCVELEKVDANKFWSGEARSKRALQLSARSS